MAELGDDKTPEVGRTASDVDRRHEMRGVMLDDMTAMADKSEDEGQETVRIPVGDSDPSGPFGGKGGEGAPGFAHVIPGNRAEIVADLSEATSFLEYEVYRAENGGCAYIATALFSLEIGAAVFITNAWDLCEALECATAVVEKGRMYSYFQKFDGTVVDVVEHDDPEKSFPNLDAIRWYASNSDGKGEGDEN